MTETHIVAVDEIDDETQYAVTLAQPVKVNRLDLLPRHDHTMKGRILKAIMLETPDAVAASSAI